jgi:hypothetical protein
MSQEIRAAIERRRLLEFTYGGHARKVVPAALGTAKRTGRPVLHAYQVEGGSAHGGIPAWRFFHTDELAGLRVLDETFAVDPPGWAPSLLENVEVSLPVTARPAGRAAPPRAPAIPPEAEKIVKDVMGAVGRWFRKK